MDTKALNLVPMVVEQTARGERSYDICSRLLKERVVFGKPLIKKQVLRHRISEWLVENEALKQLVYHIVRMKEDGQDVTREIAMGKLIAGTLLSKVMDGCLQMHGGMGLMNEMWISRAYRDARLMSIGGGASEVMSEVIFKMSGF